MEVERIIKELEEAIAIGSSQAVDMTVLAAALLYIVERLYEDDEGGIAAC